jgi:prepilin-type N-terminal cleavage/methylation domain-containing protein
MKLRKLNTDSGFTIVEVIVASVIFPMLVVIVANAYNTVAQSYALSKQFNEMYAVLSACPEIDRALQYDSINNSTNCYPNNSFKAEGGSGNIITYSPTLSVTNSSDLAPTDPLQSVPDSKIVRISTGFQNSNAPELELRMLITRNGIGQL